MESTLNLLLENTCRKMKTYGRQEFDLCQETIEEYTQAMRNNCNELDYRVILSVNI